MGLAQTLTLEQIEDYERQGLDMSEYRTQYEERKRQEQGLADVIALEKLDAYKKTRSADDAFVTDVAEFNGISDKKKSQLELAPLLYGRLRRRTVRCSVRAKMMAPPVLYSCLPSMTNIATT